MLSILITCYNRPHALLSCLKAIEGLKLEYPYEVVVSDDGSDKANVALMCSFEQIDTLLTAEANRGLGTNLNKGIKACKGKYILYCQEDFLLKKELAAIMRECISILDTQQLDMIRFQANYHFPSLKKLTDSIYAIPKFAFRNMYVNTFQYSDNPFLTTRDFFDNYGYFLEGVKGDYGETEYAIRIASSNARIGITQPYMVTANTAAPSMMRVPASAKRPKGKKRRHRLLRALRLHLEWLLYSGKRRSLLTYKKAAHPCA